MNDSAGRRQSDKKWALAGLANLLIFFPIIGSVINLLPDIDLPLDGNVLLELNRSVSIYYFFIHCLGLLLLPFTFYSCSKQRFVLSAFCILGLIGFYAFQLRPFYFNSEAAICDQSRNSPRPLSFDMLYVNVFADNDQHHKLKQQIETLDPDLIVLAETTQEWLHSLDLRDSYPDYIEMPKPDLGISIYSRFKLKKHGAYRLEPYDRPLLLVEMLLDQKTSLLLSSLHAYPPRNRSMLRSRNGLLLRAADVIAEFSGNILLVGDFNATPFSPVFKEFSAISRLNNGMYGFGLPASWHNSGIPLLYATIDHVFYRGAVTIESLVRLEDIGSDHFPYLVRVRVHPTRSIEWQQHTKQSE